MRRHANVNTVDHLGMTPLHYACEKGTYDIVRDLLDMQAHIDAACFERTTPLMRASKRGHSAVVHVLLDHGADLGLREGVTKDTALHHAAAAGSYDCVKFLLQGGADKTLTNANKETPEDVALNGRKKKCALLLHRWIARTGMYD